MGGVFLRTLRRRRLSGLEDDERAVNVVGACEGDVIIRGGFELMLGEYVVGGREGRRRSSRETAEVARERAWLALERA